MKHITEIAGRKKLTIGVSLVVLIGISILLPVLMINDKCSDDPNFKLVATPQEQLDISRDCTWVAQNPFERCGLQHQKKTIEDYWCPQTCGNCPSTQTTNSSGASSFFTSPTQSVKEKYYPSLTRSLGVSLVANWDFEEQSMAPWKAAGKVTIQKSAEHAHSGSYGALVSGRSEVYTCQGIQQRTMDVIEPGVEYDISMWAKLANVPDGETADFRLTMIEISDNGQRKFHRVVVGDMTNEWKQFIGSYTLADGNGIANLKLTAAGPENGYDFAIDEVVIEEARPTTKVADIIVSAADNTEQVIIPQPPHADVYSLRTNCPQQQGSHKIWSTQFPSLREGEDVTLPENTSILITKSITTKLGLVTIPVSSALVFGEDENGITIDIEGIAVEGSLIAGSESCRYKTPLTITLHGERPDRITDIVNQRLPSYKGISVTGALQLHGKRYYRTWTRLARRAYPGDTFLYLQDQVNWEAGQQIVLITTAMRDSRDWHQNEVFTISSVQSAGLPHSNVARVIHLTSPIQHEHIARLEYQAEIGLLSRMITIRGSENDSLPIDTTPETCQLYDHEGKADSKFGHDQVVCPDTYLTGYGGHIMVHSSGVAYVEGVELYRMGQTNVLGRYPMHFHVLGDGCPGCYLKDSSIHQSFYRCISIHGTNGVTVSENVAFDVTGNCYYLEDGVEENNILSYNLAAHIHFIGPPANGASQYIDLVHESLDLTLPADATASGFYITNLQNTIIGNVAVGGWAGFAFPVLEKPIGPSKESYPDFSPATRTTLKFDGNTAHSTAHFWGSAPAFYFGGSLYHDDTTGKLLYNAGRNNRSGDRRKPCIDDADTGKCVDAWNRITNSKVFLAPNVGIGSWSGRMEVVDYECHDVGLALEALADGFWIDNLLAACRTGERLILPVQRADYIGGNGFFWYDTRQEHIITDSTFRNCGYRSDKYNQYDTSETRGCDSDPYNGCGDRSTVFGFVTHSDQFNPEIMQGTRNITFDNAGRRFRLKRTDIDTSSGRTQNWLDTDGSVTGLGEPTLIGSGLDSAGDWWRIDDEVVNDEQGPLTFVQKNNGPARGLAHIRLAWDDSLHATVGKSACFNPGPPGSCPAVGHIRHIGSKFNSTSDPVGGLPVTANPDMVGLAGGFGWLLNLHGGAPRTLTISQVEVLPETPLTLSIAYPAETKFSVTANVAGWCKKSCSTTCDETFLQVASVAEVRASPGNVYHFDQTTGLLTIRVVMTPNSYTGEQFWKLYDFDDLGKNGEGYALNKFERNGVILPKTSSSPQIKIVADCEPDASNDAYCAASPPSSSSYDDVCSSSDFEQVGYDRCCNKLDGDDCEFSFENPIEKPIEKPSPAPIEANILKHGDFEGYGLCPWDRFGGNGHTLELETTDVSHGGGAARVSGRSKSSDGLGQAITESFAYNVTYSFRAHAKILNGASENKLKVTLRVRYDKPNNANDYITVFFMKTFPTGSWMALETSFVLMSTDLEDYPVIGLTLFFETPGSTVDFLVDAISMEPEI